MEQKSINMLRNIKLNTGTSCKVVRPLQGIEVVMASLHLNFDGATQATQVIELTGIVDTNIIHIAAKKLYDTYQALQCSIKVIENEYFFFNDVDFDDVYIKVYQTDKVDIDNKDIIDLDNCIDQSKSLWMLKVLYSTHTNKIFVVLSVCHTIIDNDGMILLANDLLSHLANNINDLSYYEIAPSINSFLREPHDKSQEDGVHYDKVKYQKVVVSNSRNTEWINFRLTTNELKIIKFEANKVGVKIHSLIASALCLATKDTKLNTNPIEFNTAVSLRYIAAGVGRVLPRLGCLVSVSKISIDISESEVFNVAKDYEYQLINDVVTNRLIKNEIDAIQIDNSIRSQLDINHFIQGIAITNLGVININQNYKDFNVTNYFTAVNRKAGNFSIALHCYEFNDEMRFSILFPSPLISHESVKIITSRMKDILRLVDYNC